MDDLIAFLRARLDDFEAAARAMLTAFPTPWETSDRGHMAKVVADKPNFAIVTQVDQNQAPDARWLGDVLEHIVLNNPDFVLADVAAKRAIIKLAAQANSLESQVDGEFRTAPRDEVTEPYVGDLILRQLALPFAGHPDYRESWRP